MSHYLKKQQQVLDRVLAEKAGQTGTSGGGLSEVSVMQLKLGGMRGKAKPAVARGKRK